MIGVCLIVAGSLRATIADETMLLAWQHSIEKTRWEERYRVDGERLRLVEARVAGSGAGMEPGLGAVERDGAWVWNPDRVVTELRLTWSSFAGDYELCAQSRCAALVQWTGPLAQGDVVTVRACPIDPRAAPGQSR